MVVCNKSQSLDTEPVFSAFPKNVSA